MRKYRIPDQDVIAGIIDKKCIRCSSLKLLVRKETFKTGGIHFSIICSPCGKHNFYVPYSEYPELLTIQGECLLPVRQELKRLRKLAQQELSL